jgi:cytochrome c oxidase assembly factor CtaG
MVHRPLRVLTRAALGCCLAGPVAAHHPGHPAGGDWNGEAWIIATISASLLLYVVGTARLWRRAGIGRGITTAAAARFAAGWGALAAALLSPLDAWAEGSFALHMVQHELLMVLAAPLLVMSRPLEAWTWALAPRWRHALAALGRARPLAGLWRALTDPVGAWTFHAVALWAWHVPWLFSMAVRDPAVHALQHSCFLLSALAFWWSVLAKGLQRAQAPALASLFTTMLHTGALGALLTFAPSPWYPHSDTLNLLGLDALEDQQLGGLVMWVPGGLAYLAAGLAIVGRWLLPAPRPQPLR